jgi:hypothetical protein
MAEEKKRWLILGGAGFALIAAAAVLFLSSREDDAIPQPTSGIYYTGPMKAKQGSGYGTIDGRPMSEAEAKAGVEQWLQNHPQAGSSKGP